MLPHVPGQRPETAPRCLANLAHSCQLHRHHLLGYCRASPVGIRRLRLVPSPALSSLPSSSPVASAVSGNVRPVGVVSSVGGGVYQTWQMAERVQVREFDDDEGRRLLRVVRRGTGSVVTWRRAQMVLLSAQKMSVAKIAEVTFTSEDRVRDVIHNFNADGFGSLYPRYAGGRPRTFNLLERRGIKKIAKSKPVEQGLPFSTWSLSKLADFLVAEGVVDDISHEGLRVRLRDEGVSFQRIKTWKTSKDPDCATKKARVEHLDAIADGGVIPEPGEPTIIVFTPGRVRAAQPHAVPRPGSGPRSAARTRFPTGNRVPAAGPPTTATTASATCSPPTT